MLDGLVVKLLQFKIALLNLNQMILNSAISREWNCRNLILDSRAKLEFVISKISSMTNWHCHQTIW